ncbi:MAG: leucine-rich repeat domain-containing protein, partial [Clostridia bacterium]|nr:leucine-rich repeat domain-containing protein [Clostridia bacterium]
IVVGVDDEFDSEYIKIPSTYQDIPVGKISYDAFTNNLKLKHVIIPDGVKSIGENTFEHCFNLISIAIPDSVKSIGERAFMNCSRLKEVNIPNIEKINDSAFSNCGFTEIKIPEGVKSIGTYAFELCTKLTSVTIPSTVTYIYHAAFRSCSNLTDIYYNGTKEQWWLSIEKEEGPFSNWDDASWDAHTGNYIVHCTDGDIK